MHVEYEREPKGESAFGSSLQASKPFSWVATLFIQLMLVLALDVYKYLLYKHSSGRYALGLEVEWSCVGPFCCERRLCSDISYIYWRISEL